MAARTNKEVGRKTGYNHTTISRLRSGGRMPSTRLLSRLCVEYGLDEGDALRTLAKDQERDDGTATEFAAWLRVHVFQEEPPQLAQAG